MKYLLVLLAVLFPHVAGANCGSTGSCVNVAVTQLRVDVNGDTFVGTSGIESNLQCRPGDKGSKNEQLLLKASGTNYSAVYSLILSSYVTEKTITIRTSNVTGETCEILYAVSTK